MNGRPQWLGPTSGRDKESYLGGGRCLRRASGGCQLPIAQAPRPGGQTV